MLEARTSGGSGNFVLYRYNPSLAAAVIFIFLFGITTIFVRKIVAR